MDMKRLAILAATSILALMLTACGEEKKPEADKTAVQVNVDENKPAEQAKPVETAPQQNQSEQPTH